MHSSLSSRFHWLKHCITLFLVICIGWVGQSLIPPTLPSQEQPLVIFSQKAPYSLKEVVLEALSKAKHSIHLLIYTLTDKEVIALLKEKSEHGVAVTVVANGKTSKGLEARLGPAVHFTRRFPTGLMHCKILIIDEQICWIGSTNFTKESLTLYSNLLLGIQGKPLAHYLIERISSLPEKGVAAKIPPAIFTVGTQTLECWLTPNATGAERIAQLIRAAKKSIRIAMFTWTHPLLREEVILAFQRGVKVEVAIDRNSGNGVSAETVHLLENAGIKVHLSQGTSLLHDKFMIVDHKVLLQGSLNWTRAAFTQNEDCFTLLQELTKEQVSFLKKRWDALLTECD